jgi:flagellar biosynthesis protein
MSEDKPNLPLAVALEYERGSREAPRVVAKGRGHVAEQIVAIAEANGIVIESDPMLAEALAQVELDDMIPIELYEAAAIVIGYILRSAKS